MGSGPVNYPELNQAGLRALFWYEPKTGELRWLKIRSCRAGAMKNGYRKVRINGRQYRASRIIWCYMTGKWPSRYIDHKNRDSGDDRWENLREANPSQNSSNTKRFSNNTSGFKGVGWCKPMKKWRARVRKDNRHIFLGYFDDPKSAYAAYCSAIVRLHGEFANDGSTVHG